MDGQITFENLTEELADKITNPSIPDTSTTVKGLVQLSDDLNSQSTSTAPTSNALSKINNKLSSAVVHIGEGAGGDELGESIAIGKNATSNNSSISIGTSSGTIKQRKGITIGHGSKGGDNSIILGYGINHPTSNLGVAIGSSSKLIGHYSVTVGAESFVHNWGVSIGTGASTGDGSIAIGYNAKALGTGSLALGREVASLNNNESILGTKDSYLSRWVIPGELSVEGTKKFEIPHPNPDKEYTHVLRHGAVESPTSGDNMYRYWIEFSSENKAQVKMAGMNKTIEVDVNKTGDVYNISIKLPDYWIWLNKDAQVMISPNSHFGSGFGKVNYSNEMLELSFENPLSYSAVLLGTRNDKHPSVQSWGIKGAVRETGETWLGDTSFIEIEEFTETKEFAEKYL